MCNGIVPLLSLTSQFTQNILSTSIRWINLQFLLEFLLGVLSHCRTGIRFGEQQPSHSKVDTRSSGVLFENPAILLSGLVPLPTYFERLSIQFMCFVGIRRVARQGLRER